jgi:pimeloyl-ACP methyl ester carboxylesterase
MAPLLILPFPDVGPSSRPSPISAPLESAFTNTFGQLLPSATYISTEHGRAAYYHITPSSYTTRSRRVLLVHGVQTPALGLLPLAQALLARDPTLSIVLVDLWGHGLTDTPEIAHTPSLFHGLISSVLDDVKWSSAHIVGYSFGGSLLAGYLASSPDKVDSAVLIAPAGLLRTSNFSPGDQKVLRGDKDVTDEEARSFMLNFLEDGELVIPPDWKERVGRGEVVAEAIRSWELAEHAGHEGSVLAILRHGGVVDNHSAFQTTVGKGVPCLAIVGTEDPVCSVTDLEEVGWSNVKVVQDAGHGLVRQRAEEVAGMIMEFWA